MMAAWKLAPALAGGNTVVLKPSEQTPLTKRTHLELGGKAPVIVFDDADLAAVVEGVKVFGYYNAGQDCTAACRIYAGAKIYDSLVADLPLPSGPSGSTTPTTTRTTSGRSFRPANGRASPPSSNARWKQSTFPSLPVVGRSGARFLL